MKDKIIQLEECVTADMTSDLDNRVGYWNELAYAPDTAWSLHDESFLLGLIPYGRMSLNAIKECDRQLQAALDTVYNEQLKVRATCAVAGALNSQKDFDMIIKYPCLEKHEMYVDVPKTIKTGLFKKSAIYEKQRKDSFAYIEKQITFSGWRIAHFERRYRAIAQSYQRTLNWDFALGDDGNIYHITYGYTKYDSAALAHMTGETTGYKFFYEVRKAIFYDTCFLSNKNRAYFLAVANGVLITVGNILLEMEATPGEYQTYYIDPNGNEEYYYNFPLSPSKNTQFNLEKLYSILESFYTPQ